MLVFRVVFNPLPEVLQGAVRLALIEVCDTDGSQRFEVARVFLYGGSETSDSLSIVVVVSMALSAAETSRI